MTWLWVVLLVAWVPWFAKVAKSTSARAASQDMNTPEPENAKSDRVVPSGKPGQEKTK